MQELPRIEFGGRRIDFDKPVSEFRNEPFTNRVRTGLASGKRSILSLYDKERVEALLDFQEAQKVISEIRKLHEYAKGGANFKFWRDRNLAGYWAFEGTLRNNNREDGVFTRGSTAYYQEGTTGILTQSTGNLPRYVAGKFGTALKISGSRTNLITHPSDFANASWTGTAPTIVTDTPETTDPAGANNADKLSSGLSSFRTAATSTPLGSQDGAFSIWLKSVSGTVNGVTLIIGTDLNQGLHSQSFNVDPVWRKYATVYESTGSEAGDALFSLSLPATTTGVYAYGAAGFIGTDVLFIDDEPDTLATAQATLLGEKCLLPATNINREKLSVAFWFKPEWVWNKHPAAFIFQTGTDSGTNRHLSVAVLASGLWEIRFYGSDQVVRAQILPSASQLVQGNWHRAVVTADSTVSNGLNLYIDGQLLGTSSNSPFNANNVGTQFVLGSAFTAVSQAFGSFDELVIWNDVLTVADIKADYNRSIALGLDRNYWPALELLIPEFRPEIVRGSEMYRYLLQALEVL